MRHPLPPSRERERLRRQSRALASRAAAVPLARPLEADRLADEAAALARRADAPLLEAQALLVRARLRAPSSEPDALLAASERAAAVFEAYGQLVAAAQCQLGRAAALADLGQEQRAIGIATRTADLATLPLDDRIAARLLVARCQLHLGDPAAARRVLDEAEALCKGIASAEVRAVLHWTRATLMLSSHLAAEHRALWITYPSNVPHALRAANEAEVARELDAAQALLPSRPCWTHLTISRQLSRALFRRDVDAATALLELAQASEADDPAGAAHALLVAGLVQRLARSNAEALHTFFRATALAERTRQHALRRDLLGQMAALLEAKGDAPAALALLKQHAALATESLTEMSSDAQLAPVPSASTAPPSRRLEPTYLRTALRYIEQQGRPVPEVGQIAAYCGVARRTLEQAFFDHRATSIGEYLLQLRLEHAARLLSDTRAELHEVAQAAGYRSNSAFVRAFRLRYGQTPTRWRESSGRS